MGKTNYKGLRVDYQPRQKVKVMLGRDWYDAEVVKANKKTVIVNTLFSKTKYRRVPIKPIAATSQVPDGLGTVLEPYTVSGTKIVKLSRVRVKPIEWPEAHVAGEQIDFAKDYVLDPLEQPEPKYEDPGLGKDEAPLVAEPDNLQATIDQVDAEPKAETKPETAADVLERLVKMLEG